jgi:hypothetical protein
MCLSHFTSTYQLFTHSSTQQIVLSLGMITLCGKKYLTYNPIIRSSNLKSCDCSI